MRYTINGTGNNCNLNINFDNISPKKANEILEKLSDENLSKLDELCLKIIRDGRKLDAVKLYKEEKECGLKEAKDYLDDLEKKHVIP